MNDEGDFGSPGVVSGCRCCAWARTPMTSKSGQGARFSAGWNRAFAWTFIGACSAASVNAEHEARASAADFLAEAASRTIEIMNFRDGFFPEQGEQIKVWFEALKDRVNPDVILTHRGDDAHQDHRQVSSPRLEYVSRSSRSRIRDPEMGWRHGETQSLCAGFGVCHAAQDGFADVALWQPALQAVVRSETFLGLARLRGMECRAQERYAEAFVARKLSLA